MKNGNVETPYISWANTTWVESINPFEGKVASSDINPFDLWFDQPTINYWRYFNIEYLPQHLDMER